MARMSIDDMLGRDPRLLRLAKACGLSKYETVGRLVLDVWPVCYDRASACLDAGDIDIATGIDGFAEHMIVAGLAFRTRTQVRVAGVQERIDYLTRQRDAGKAGGLKSAESRTGRFKRASSDPSTDPQASLKQASSTASSEPQATTEATLKPPIATVPDTASAPAPAPAPDKPPAPVKKMAASRPTPPHRAAVMDAWHLAFRRATSGGTATWGDAQLGAASTLCQKHGEDEIVRRIENYYAAPPDWPKGQWDWLTFVKNFDRCASRHGGAKTALEQQLDRVRMLEAKEAAEREQQFELEAT